MNDSRVTDPGSVVAAVRCRRREVADRASRIAGEARHTAQGFANSTSAPRAFLSEGRKLKFSNNGPATKIEL